jgi:predicted metal-dependent HD superfamily phosphohydrolase
MTSPDQRSAAAEGDATARTDLGARFQRTWTRLRGHDPAAIYRVLARFYGQPHRHYHTLAHVEDCLQEADAFQAAQPTFLSAEMWHAVELALWFHDVIHQPRADDNEERSADVFDAIASAAMVAPPLIAAVRRLILATKVDATSPAAEEQVIIDCDLSSLGYAPAVFRRSGVAIRKEYDFVPDKDFAETRRATFLRLSQRPGIFRTDFMRHRYEQQARANLATALAAL